MHTPDSPVCGRLYHLDHVNTCGEVLQWWHRRSPRFSKTSSVMKQMATINLRYTLGHLFLIFSKLLWANCGLLNVFLLSCCLLKHSICWWKSLWYFDTLYIACTHVYRIQSTLFLPTSHPSTLPISSDHEFPLRQLPLENMQYLSLWVWPISLM